MKSLTWITHGYILRFMDMTQNEIAAKAGLSQAFVSQILSGEKLPSRDSAVRLEAATGIHRLWWLYRDQYDQSGRPIPAQPQDAA